MSLNSLLDKAISVANVAGKKTEEMVEASKLKLQEVSVNADLQDCYEKIGSLVYRSKKSGEDNEQAIEQLVEQADVLLEQLAQLQSKREEIKKMKKCPNCGASCNVDSHFCSRCGMVLHEQSDLVPTQPQEEQPQQAEQAEQPVNQEEKPLIEEKLQESKGCIRGPADSRSFCCCNVGAAHDWNAQGIYSKGKE